MNSWRLVKFADFTTLNDCDPAQPIFCIAIVGYYVIYVHLTHLQRVIISIRCRQNKAVTGLVVHSSDVSSRPNEKFYNFSVIVHARNQKRSHVVVIADFDVAFTKNK